MKSIQVLFMLFIGMMSFTVTGATVTNPQQKQKREIQKTVSTLTPNGIKCCAGQMGTIPLPPKPRG